MTRTAHAPEGATVVIVTHRTLPGRRDEARAVWERLLRPAIEANPDHLSYLHADDVADADVIRAVQVYATADAARAFLATPAYAAYVAAVEPLLAGEPDVAVARIRWSKE